MNKLFAGDPKSIRRSIITAVIALFLSLTIVASTAFASAMSSFDVEVRVDNNSFVVTTNESHAIEILQQANITLDDNDRLDISGFTAGKGGVIKVDKQNTVNILYKSNISSYSVYGDTVKDALKELGIKANATTTNANLNANVTNGMVIKVKNVSSVSIKCDGKTIKYPLTNMTVGELVKNAGIILGEDDYIQPSDNKKLSSNMKITVNRVSYKLETVSEKVEYDTIEKEDSSMYEGVEDVVKDGVNGKDKVTYNVKYVNGKKKTKTELTRKTVAKPVDEVVKVGTKEVKGNKDIAPNGVKSKNGYSIGQTINGRYTHYCACGICGSGTGRTASGRKVYNGMKDPYYIACNWLPLGSVVNVDGYNYLVVDRGGSGLSARGRIDIFTTEGHRACFKYGTGGCKITIVRLGW